MPSIRIISTVICSETDGLYHRIDGVEPKKDSECSRIRPSHLSSASGNTRREQNLMALAMKRPYHVTIAQALSPVQMFHLLINGTVGGIIVRRFGRPRLSPRIQDVERAQGNKITQTVRVKRSSLRFDLVSESMMEKLTLYSTKATYLQSSLEQDD